LGEFQIKDDPLPYDTMITTKLTALIAAIAVVGVSAPAALADSSYWDPTDPSISVSQSRGDNINSQSVEQENEACTNDIKAKEKGKGDQYVDADQKNKCKVYQSNYASQYADIDDYSYTSNYAEIFQYN
jgi:hypothetical protein